MLMNLKWANSYQIPDTELDTRLELNKLLSLLLLFSKSPGKVGGRAQI